MRCRRSVYILVHNHRNISATEAQYLQETEHGTLLVPSKVLHGRKKGAPTAAKSKWWRVCIQMGAGMKTKKGTGKRKKKKKKKKKEEKKGEF
jgi:hypothetical protein